MAFDYSKLSKLMQMTQSENDGEALTALRMANKMIASAGLNWAEFIDEGFEVPEDELITSSEFTPPSYFEAKQSDIERMFLVIMEQQLDGSFGDFVTSVFDQFDRTKRLTEKQYAAVTKSYWRAKANSGDMFADLGI